VALSDLEGLFKCIGLLKPDAEVYATLLSKGPLTITGMAKELGKHRPQIYESLERLKAKGLVEASRGKPTLYRAVEPEVLLGVFEEEVESLRERALAYLGSLKRERAPSVEYGVWTLRSYKGLLRRFRDSIHRAEVDLMVCGAPRFLREIIGDLASAHERGVIVYVIAYEVPGQPLDFDLLRPLRKVKVAVSGDLLVVRDSEQAVLAHRVLGPRARPEYGLLIEEPALIDYLLHDFFNRWLRGRPVRDETIGLPSSFTAFRMAVLEVSRLLEEGIELYAELEGRWVRSGREGALEGRVADVVMDLTTGLVHLVIETDGERVRAGGPDAIVEEFATRKVTLRRCD